MSVFRWNQNILLISLLVIFAGGVAVAQSVLPPDENLDDKPKKIEKTIRIDSRALELAENYIYVLEQLRFLTHDYSRYLAESKAGISKEYLAAVTEISKELAKGTYYEKKRLSLTPTCPNSTSNSPMPCTPTRSITRSTLMPKKTWQEHEDFSAA